MSSGPFEEHCDFRFSLVLATKDRPGQLEKVLDDIRRNKRREDQLIVVDDSEDGSAREVCEHYWVWVDAYLAGPGPGMSEAYNRGLLLARGCYIKFLADDDETHWPELDRAWEHLRQHPEIDLLMCGGVKLLGDQRTEIRYPDGYGLTVDTILVRGATAMGILLRREALARTGLLARQIMPWDIALVAEAQAQGLVVRPGDFAIFVHYLGQHDEEYAKRWRRELDEIARRYGKVIGTRAQ